MPKKKQPTILIIEDDVTLLKALVLAFENAGLKTIQSVSAEDALNLTAKDHPELILLDIRLPKMDGLSLLRQMRLSKDEWAREVPVILLTNVNSPEHVAKATEYQAYDYLVKSDWRLQEIVDKVKQKLHLDK